MQKVVRTHCCLLSLIFAIAALIGASVVQFLPAYAVADGDDCSWYCQDRIYCTHSADEDCPGCDPYGTQSCDGWIRRVFNPAGLVIKDKIPGGNQKVADQGDVICFQDQECVEGSWLVMHSCASGVYCMSSFPYPLVCQQCAAGGPVIPYTVRDYECYACGE